MKQKGFTLVELLAIVILLGIVFALVYPNIIAQIEKNDKKINEYTLELIYNAANTYIKKNNIIEVGKTYCVEVSKLDSENLIPVDIDDYKDKSIIVRVGKNKKTYNFVDDCQVTLRLENAKFTDGTTNKTVDFGTEVEIIAIIPSNYTENDYVGNLTCSNSNDVGKTKYRVKHEYSLENWNIRNTKNTTIKYIANEGNKVIRANIKDVTTQVNKYRCDSTGRSYQSAYYSCPGGFSLSGSVCAYSYGASCSWGYNCTGYTCGHSGGSGPNDCQWESGLWCESCSCPSGGSLQYNQTCLITTSRTYHEGYYYCPSGWSQSGTVCYKWTGV